jgi:hypothetical protein
VFRTLLAPLTEFLDDQSILVELLVFSGMVVDVMTNRAFHANQIIL